MNIYKTFIIILSCTIASCNAMETGRSQSAPLQPTPADIIISPRKFSLKTAKADESKFNSNHLFVAVRKKNIDELKRMMRLHYIYDANIQEEDTKNTLLHYAIFNRDEKTAQFLMKEAKADPSIVNNAGKSSLDVAKEYGFVYLESLMNEYLMSDLYSQSHSSLPVKSKPSNA